ncbi:MAG: hypothetical protein ACE366_02210 [Bradymonadia bacterium]
MVDLVRGEAVSLSESEFLVMTRENILEMLPPGVDLAQCEGECEVETGRNIGADYIVSGSFVEVGGDIKVSMRLYDTQTGALKSSQNGTALGVSQLDTLVQKMSAQVFRTLKQKSGAKKTFGLGVPLQNQNTLLVMPEQVQPDLGSLADLDVGMLQHYECCS